MDAAGRAARGLLILALGCAADDFQNGAELARSGRWEQARAAFLKGQRAAPRDKRFPLELAGVEYRLRNIPAAKRDLRRALRLDPGDRYGSDFLGSLYFLDGNLEAALRYWNRIGKPRIEDVIVSPERRVNPVLLDSALAFAPASVLTLDGWRTTEARLHALDLFPAYRLDLAAHGEERFDAALHWLELPAWMQAASAFRGAAYQTVMPEVRNIVGSGMNADALLRWDAQKRRAGISVAGSLHRNAKWRYRWYADGRREIWNSGALEDFRLQRLASGVELQAIPNGRLQWQMGTEVSSRHFANLPEFPGGTALEYRTSMTYELLRVPEQRIAVSSGLAASLGRRFSGTGNPYGQGQAFIQARWLPQARGDDYEVNARLRAGTTQGTAPFDELFQLGVERDNDLWLRGHAGTIGGKKGSAPIGRNYVLANWDFHKQLYRHSFFSVEAGPFLDTGRINDTFGRSGFRNWLVDAGLEASVRLAGALRVTLIYGRDLRGGGHVIYGTSGE